MQPSKILAQKMAEIRPRFLDTLSRRLDRFENIRDALDTSADIRPLLEEIRNGAHTIIGLAATLGFSDLGRLAQEVEECILGIGKAEEARHRSSEFLGRFDALLGEMALVLHS